MLNLLKADLYRVVRDKLFILTCFLCVGIAVFYTALFGLISRLSGDALSVGGEIMSQGQLTALAMSPSSGFGLVLGIFIVILVGKDGVTLRNKVIVGKTRAEIYFSNIILCEILYIGFMACHVIITYLLASMLIPGTFQGVQVYNIFVDVLIRMLGFVGIGAFIGFLATAMPNMALGIIFSILGVSIAVYGGMIFQSLLLMLVSEAEMTENVAYLVTSIPYMVTPYALSVGDYPLSNSWFWIFFVTSVILNGGAFIGIGYVMFKHKNLR